MKKIVVLGGGESGCGSAVLAKLKGFDVFLSDSGTLSQKYVETLQKYSIEFEQGGHSLERIWEADEVVKSPGIPDYSAIVVSLREKGVRIISEIEFAGRFCKGRTICITGSNGKTTTTTMIYKMLQKGGFDVALGGNIGESFAMKVALGGAQWYVLELSSFQLDGMYDFRADVSVLMNITPDHLDRYQYNFDNYVNSKFRVLNNQRGEDFFIYCGDDAVVERRMKTFDGAVRPLPFGFGREVCPGGSANDEIMKCCLASRMFLEPVDRVGVRGRHNLYNAMASTLAAMCAGVDDEAIREVLENFGGVEHRLELIGEVEGVEWINDSKATNVDSAWYALDSMTKPTIWIAGGTDKGNDYERLLNLARKKVKCLVCMGLDNSKLLSAFEGVVPSVVSTSSLSEALSAARSAASSGDVVLLSPACASFDLFQNFEDRGTRFKEGVLANKF